MSNNTKNLIKQFKKHRSLKLIEDEDFIRKRDSGNAMLSQRIGSLTPAQNYDSIYNMSNCSESMESLPGHEFAMLHNIKPLMINSVGNNQDEPQ